MFATIYSYPSHDQSGQISSTALDHILEHYSLAMQHVIPRRIVLRFSVAYELEEAAIIERFFTEFGPKPADDFYSHLMAPNESSKMHIILDMHCKTVPTVELDKIVYEVFKVRRNKELYVGSFSKEGTSNHWSVTFSSSINLLAIMLACGAVMFGGATNRRQPEELDGERLAQVGHSPGRLVS
jgi:hypothetical protein